MAHYWTMHMLHFPDSVEVWRWKHKLSRIKITSKSSWESFHTSTHTYFFGRKDAVLEVLGQIGARRPNSISIEAFGIICCHWMDDALSSAFFDRIISRFSSWIACVSNSVSNT